MRAQPLSAQFCGPDAAAGRDKNTALLFSAWEMSASTWRKFSSTYTGDQFKKAYHTVLGGKVGGDDLSH